MKQSMPRRILDVLVFCCVVYKIWLYLIFFLYVRPNSHHAALKLTGNAAFFEKIEDIHVTNLEKCIWAASNITGQQIFCDGVILIILGLLFVGNGGNKLREDLST